MPPKPGRVVLVHGGLYEEMTAERFWGDPGVITGMQAAGFDVHAPDRDPHPTSWRDEAEHLAHQVKAPAAIVAGSNGCSAAVRLAIDHPRLVARLVLCWPATAGDREVDGRVRAMMRAQDVPGEVIDVVLAGETLRGATDKELAALPIPVAIAPALAPNPVHQRRTVDALAALIPGAVVTAGFPESPRPEFGEHRDAFVAMLAEQLDGMAPNTPA